MIDLQTPRVYIDVEQVDDYKARSDFVPVAKYGTLVPQEMTEIGCIVVGRVEKEIDGVVIRSGGECAQRVIVREIAFDLAQVSAV